MACTALKHSGKSASFFFFNIGCAGSLLWHVGFSLWCVGGFFSSYSTRASPVVEHRLQSTQAPEHAGSVVVVQLGLVALLHVEFYFFDQGLNLCPLHWKANS